MHTIMVTDDEAIVRNLIVNLLSREGYKTLPAEGAVEALTISETWADPIDLLIVDYHLKLVNGPQLAQRLAESRPELKVLHISGDPIESVEAQQGVSPNDWFLQKPFTPIDLIAHVRHILGAPYNRSLSAAKLFMP